MATNQKMKAPNGCNAAVIDGHEYSIGKDGVITVAQEHHLATLKRHGFTDHHEESVDVEAQIDAMDDKAELVEFIEERGGTADTDMSMKKLKKLAHDAVAG